MRQASLSPFYQGSERQIYLLVQCHRHSKCKLRLKPRSGHLRSLCPFYHSSLHLLPPPASIPGPDLPPSVPPSPGHLQVLAHLWVLALEAALLFPLCICAPQQLGNYKGEGKCASGNEGYAPLFLPPFPFASSSDPEVPSSPLASSTQASHPRASSHLLVPPAWQEADAAVECKEGLSSTHV